MNGDLIDWLREFGVDEPAPTEDLARRVYARATRYRVLRPNRARWFASRPRTVFAAIAVAAAAATAGTLSTTLIHAAGDPNLPARQAQVDAAVSQVQNAFGDQRVVSAQLAGSELTVTLADGSPSDLTIGHFEAEILAHLADSNLSSDGLAGVALLTWQTASGSSSAPGLDGVGPLTAQPLAAHACSSAAAAIPASVTIDSTTQPTGVTASSGQMLQVLHGVCVFKITTNDPASFALGAGMSLGQMLSSAAGVSSHPYLVEVSDPQGAPQLISSWVPASGGEPDAVATGQGSTWLQRGLCGPSVSLGGPVGSCSSSSGS